MRTDGMPERVAIIAAGLEACDRLLEAAPDNPDLLTARKLLEEDLQEAVAEEYARLEHDAHVERIEQLAGTDQL